MTFIKSYAFLIIFSLSLSMMIYGIDNKELALKYAPILLLDEKEPFTPYKVGFTIYGENSLSSSFNRKILLEEDEICIEYAIYWDFDIEHMYDLEHVWIYVKDDKITKIEGSWHGKYKTFYNFQLFDDKPILYVQPGKHAMSSSKEIYKEDLFNYLRTVIPCLFLSGREGLLQKNYKINLTKEEEKRIKDYLKRYSFIPSFVFSKRFVINEAILLTWEELKKEIPNRIKDLLNQIIK